MTLVSTSAGVLDGLTRGSHQMEPAVANDILNLRRRGCSGNVRGVVFQVDRCGFDPVHVAQRFPQTIRAILTSHALDFIGLESFIRIDLGHRAFPAPAIDRTPTD